MENLTEAFNKISNNLDKAMAETKELWADYDRQIESDSHGNKLQSALNRYEQAIYHYVLENVEEVNPDSAKDCIDWFMAEYLEGDRV